MDNLFGFGTGTEGKATSPPPAKREIKVKGSDLIQPSEIHTEEETESERSPLAEYIVMGEILLNPRFKRKKY